MERFLILAAVLLAAFAAPHCAEAQIPGIGSGVALLSSDNVFKRNCIAFYRLESDGTDYNGRGLKLTASGSPTFAPGKVGYSASLASASSQYFSASSDSRFAPQGPLYVCAWVKLNGVGSLQGIACRYHTSTSTERSFFFGVTSGNKLRFNPCTDSSNVNVDHAVTLTTDTWYFCEGLWDGTTAYVNVNRGTEASSAAAGTRIQDCSQNVVIGAYASNSQTNYFNGQIDSLYFASFVPTAAQRDFLYNGGNGRDPF